MTALVTPPKPHPPFTILEVIQPINLHIKINILRVISVFQIKKVKNVSHDVFGSKLGRVHMKRQDFGRLQTRKVRGLKRSRDMRDSAANAGRKKQKVS